MTQAASPATEVLVGHAERVGGIGFRTADTIADRLGIEKTAMLRMRAGGSFALTEAMGEGRCGLSFFGTIAAKPDAGVELSKLLIAAYEDR
jgi:hypothetical protein